MSGWALVFHRDCSPVNPPELDGIMARLKHRGPDGSAVKLLGEIGLGHQHFWVTPEDMDERQPVHSADERYWLVFDGRLDNREDLLGRLSLNTPEGRALSDAALSLRMILRFGQDAYTYMVGPYAIALWDSVEQQVTLARNPMGSASLFYYLDDHYLLAASEPFALTAHPEVSGELDEYGLACYYAVFSGEAEATLFSGVKELPAAHVLSVNPTQSQIGQYWRYETPPRLHYKREETYAEHLLDLLRQSVQSCLRATTAPHIMMSGGIDSTSIAALVSLEVVGDPSRRLGAISWVFDELTDVDEREYIQPMYKRFDMDPLPFEGDGMWPLRDWNNWPHNPNYPIATPYRLLHEEAYRITHERGSRVLLTGAHSDFYFLGGSFWLVDLLQTGNFKQAIAGLIRLARSGSGRREWLRKAIHRLAGWWLDMLPGGRVLRPHRQAQPPEWLSAAVTEQLRDLYTSRRVDEGPHNRLYLARSVFNREGGTSTIVAYLAHRWTLEIRDPYLDRRLAEFMLALPAYQFFDGYRRKTILHNAMTDILPEQVLSKDRPTQYYSLLERGLYQREHDTALELLLHPEARWRSFVRPEYTIGWNKNKPVLVRDEMGQMVMWRSLAMEIWLHKMK